MDLDKSENLLDYIEFFTPKISSNKLLCAAITEPQSDAHFFVAISHTNLNHIRVTCLSKHNSLTFAFALQISNLTRNDKKNRRFSAAEPPILDSSLLYTIKAIVMPHLNDVYLFLD